MATERVIAVHTIDTTDGNTHLADVIADMRSMGAPTIRAVRTAGYGLLAIEGCHRLAAAHVLGLTPRIEVVLDDSDYDHDAMITVQIRGEDETMTADDLLAWVMSELMSCGQAYDAEVM